MIFTVDDVIQELDYWTIYNLVEDDDIRAELMGVGIMTFVNPKGQWVNAEEVLV